MPSVICPGRQKHRQSRAPRFPSTNQKLVRIAPPAIRADAAYLITGGHGGLGLAVARWLVEKGARHLVLLGRSGANPDSQKVIAELAAKGAAVLDDLLPMFRCRNLRCLRVIRNSRSDAAAPWSDSCCRSAGRSPAPQTARGKFPPSSRSQSFRSVESPHLNSTNAARFLHPVLFGRLGP